MVVRDTTSITAMATESPTVESLVLLAGAPEPEDVQTNITSSYKHFHSWLPCIWLYNIVGFNLCAHYLTEMPNCLREEGWGGK